MQRIGSGRVRYFRVAAETAFHQMSSESGNIPDRDDVLFTFDLAGNGHVLRFKVS